MACPEDISTLTDKLISFNAKYTLNGEFSGTILFANANCDLQSGCAVCSPIQVTVDSSHTEICADCLDEDLTACLEAVSPNWINGLVTSYQQAGYVNAVPTMSGTVVSYANYLKTKPINTEMFAHEDLANAISDIAVIYAGIPAPLIDINVVPGAFFFQGPVQGNSTWDEFQRLAQAGYCHVFTQVGGVLTFDPWKDETSAVDYILPKELLISVEKAPVANNETSVITLRGSAYSKFDCGNQVFTDNSIDGLSNNAGHLVACATSGVPTPELGVTFENLAAEKKDLLNAEIAADGVTTKGVQNAKDGAFSTQIAKSNGDWFDSSDSEYKVVVSGRRRPNREGEFGDFLAPGISDTLRDWSIRFHEQWSSRSRWPIPANSFFASTIYGDGGNASSSNYADQQSIDRIETSVVDVDFSACGLRSEQIDNPYVPSKERLFALGVRRFKEMKMQQDTWFLELPYLPCLRLNQVVQFQASMQEGCDSEVITGVIAGIEIDYTAGTSENGPRAVMRLVIWGFSCLGSTTYISDNLIISPCAGSESAVTNPWVATSLSLDSQATLDRYSGVLYTVGFPSIASFTLSQEEMTVGDSYTISFDYELLEGAGSFSFTHPGGLSVIAGTGTSTNVFVAGLVNFSFSWILQNTFVPTAYLFTNFKLTKTIIA